MHDGTEIKAPSASVTDRKTTARRIGLSTATLDRLVASNDFPKPIKLSPRRVGWRVADVDRWIADRANA
jgi:prophage regulatory protein